MRDLHFHLYPLFTPSLSYTPPLMTGTRKGTLRFLGETDFAKGVWAGIELDERHGKNDGSVSGKRYFTCRALYGLFAPSHKVTKLEGADAQGTIT